MDPRIKVAAARLLDETERNSRYTEEQLKTAGLFTAGLSAFLPALISGKGEDVLAGALGGYGGGVSGGGAAALASAGGRHLIDALGSKLPQNAINNEFTRGAAKWGVSALAGLYAPKMLRKLKRWHMEEDDDEG